MSLGECLCFAHAAARRHGEDHLARRRMNAQRVTARAPMPAELDGEELRAVPDHESRGFGGPPVEERAGSHVWKSGEEQFPRNLPYPPPWKSLGAKTNHLPNIQGSGGLPPLPAGVGAKKFRSIPVQMRGSKTESILIHSKGCESEFPVWIQAVNAKANSHSGFRYSAAECATLSDGFLLVAAEIMKSLMRGTISERKREPLNTP